ncbi:MAG: ATP-binding cassette domain-containing protein [Ruminococcaceae bacterium]|nr:ATP-binding cassette domain-containing protein [Oscillospiraceae bacterium]
MALIEIQNLKKYFDVAKGTLHAVDDVSISIDAGKTVGVVGESGCGKSTLGKTIMRLVEPSSGKIIYDGVDITELSMREFKPYRQKIQMIFQDPFASLDPRMSVSQLIAEPIRSLAGVKDSAEITRRVYELMDLVGLARRLENVYPHELDGGRRQRIGIARALASEPQMIVCDEPVSALDVSIQAQILNLLQDLQKERSLTYIFITHDLSVVKHISDQIVVMYLGQIVEKADSKELFANTLHPYTQALLSAIPIPTLQRENKRIVLKGELSSPIDPKPGCRFAPRCIYARDKCRGETPELRDCGNGHYVACHYAGETGINSD